MIKSPIFFDVILPVCVSGAFCGFFLLLILSRVLFDYMERNYSNLLPRTDSQTFWVDQDMAMAFVGDIWALTRSGRFRQLPSRFWRGMFWLNATVGGITIASLLTLFVAFLS
ncbi:hypothetical protein [Andreprevotia chitinilytica]|uniref:hypothetical protein n=1 Tax=Andreprevotia chitinilytica TaxID=396808 RepID=UPI00054D30FB|nr:hypothetical protein [Andreprevotia chitinilytica]